MCLVLTYLVLTRLLPAPVLNTQIYIHTVVGERRACCMFGLISLGSKNQQSRYPKLFQLLVGHFCWQIHGVLGFAAFGWKHIPGETRVCLCGVSLWELFHNCDFAMWFCYLEFSQETGQRPNKQNHGIIINHPIWGCTCMDVWSILLKDILMEHVAKICCCAKILRLPLIDVLRLPRDLS